MNTFLLLKVKAAILENPEAFHMSTWDCGNMACIAGWTCRIAGEKAPEYKRGIPRATWFVLTASRLLKIDLDQSYRLFLAGRWPYQFRRSLKPPHEAAADRIDHFIATDGQE